MLRTRRPAGSHKRILDYLMIAILGGLADVERDVERPCPQLQRQHGQDFEAQDMSAGRIWADEGGQFGAAIFTTIEVPTLAR